MKPIKPKKMPKRLEASLKNCANHPIEHDLMLSRASVRSILAALAYERQRAEEWAKQAHEATQAVLRVATPALDNLKVSKDAFALSSDCMRVLTNDGRLMPLADFQREQTEAVVPKPRRKKS